MATLIAVYSSDGCKGRCDATCYEAIEPECKCICGGRNHGAGYKKAMENTRELAQKMVDEYSKQMGMTFEKVVIPDEVKQIPFPF